MAKTKITSAVKNELERIRSTQPDKLLRPIDVVSEARDCDNPLHDHFTWDDTKAAHEFRLVEARKLIQVVVEILPGAKKAPMYVSLRIDRAKPHGGYRALVTVMSKAEQRAALLAEALDDLKMWQQRYAMFKELGPIFDAMKNVKRSVTGKKKKKKK